MNNIMLHSTYIINTGVVGCKFIPLNDNYYQSYNANIIKAQNTFNYIFCDFVPISVLVSTTYIAVTYIINRCHGMKMHTTAAIHKWCSWISCLVLKVWLSKAIRYKLTPIIIVWVFSSRPRNNESPRNGRTRYYSWSHPIIYHILCHLPIRI